MSKYQSFVFENYDFNRDEKTLKLRYSLDGEIFFEEIFTFNFDFADHDEVALDKAVQVLFFVAGVSYYKTYMPPKIVVKSGSLTNEEAEFYSKTYQKGLGEFFYVNNLDPNTRISFPVNSESSGQKFTSQGKGFLVAVGGGKDSLVSVDLLHRNISEDVATWSLNHENQLKDLVDLIGTKHYFVGRTWDEKLNNPGALPDSYNGHIPISAIFACAGTVVAILAGKRDIVMSNERSADEPTLNYRGTPINHQYSKSSEFERDFQAQLLSSFGEDLRYYSLLRPLSEIQIAKLFGRNLFEKYKDVFSSCNKAFVHGSDKMFWDGECPKCAFVFLVLSEYCSMNELEKLMGGNVLLKPQLEDTYKELLGITHNKPLECVGEINESRWAMDRRKLDFSELEKYIYDSIPDEKVFYLADNSIPEEIYALIRLDFETNALQR